MSGFTVLKGVPRKGALFAFWGVLLFGALLFRAEAQPCLPFQADEWVGVSYVYDGDTVRLGDGRKVRLIGINAPEVGHDGSTSEPLGDAARQALQGLLMGQARIALRYEGERRDRYGRLLAHLYLSDQRTIQERLLEQGLAAAVAIAPNVANLDCYLAAEARAGGRGIWRQRRFKAYDVDDLPADARGFYLVQGQVAHIGEDRQALWLKLANGGRGQVVVRIDNRELSRFAPVFDLRQLQGRKIGVRGWLSEGGGGSLMRIYHPAALQLIDR